MLVNLAPDLKPKLITGTDYVVRRDWNIVDRCKCRWRRIEEARAEDGQHPPSASSHYLLKFSQRWGRDGLRRRLPLRLVFGVWG